MNWQCIRAFISDMCILILVVFTIRRRRRRRHGCAAGVAIVVGLAAVDLGLHANSVVWQLHHTGYARG